MKNLFRKQNIETYLVVLLIGFFGVFYWQTIMNLPLFGDATIHGAVARDLLDKGWQALTADYPPFYYYLMVICYSIIGEKGFNLVPYVGFLFLLISIFLLIRQLTKNYYVSLLSIMLVGSSPKVIYYSARMYQEILLSAFFIITIYFAFKFIEAKKSSYLYLTALFCGLSLSMKQQGLFILYVSLFIFFLVNFMKKNLGLKNFILITSIPLIIGFPFYGVLFHTKGEIQPGSGEFKVFKIINNIGKKVFLYREPKTSNSNQEESLFTYPSKAYADSSVAKGNPLDIDLQRISDKFSTKAFSLAESRHIWPTDVFTNYDKFNEANNLYLLSWQGAKLESPLLFYFCLIMLIAGFIYCCFYFRQYSNLLIFTFFFLCINYILFSRNNDQQRYHIFLPIYLLTFTLIIVSYISKRININYFIKISSVAGLSIILFLTVLIPRIQLNQVWANTQIYSSSTGGIDSIKEAGNWIEDNTSETTIIGQQCGNETKYYANRQVIGDWRAYFLNITSLKSFFKSQSISYYVIYKSQIVDDSKWKHICWVPRSFFNEMNDNFKLVYKTKVNDIFIYDVR